MALQRDVVAVGIGDGVTMHRARRHVQREGSGGLHSRHVVLIGRLGADGARTLGLDGAGVGVLDGIAVQVLAAGGVVLALVEHAVAVFPIGGVAAVDACLVVGAAALAVEGAVLEGAVIATYQSAHVGIVVLYVGRHAAVLNRAVVLASDAAHLGRGCHAGVFPVAADVAAHPAVADGAVVLAGDAAHQSGFGAMDVGYHVEILHRGLFPYSIKQTLVVVVDVRDFDFDGVAIAVACHRKAITSCNSIMFRTISTMSNQSCPISCSHIEIGINADII